MSYSITDIQAKQDGDILVATFLLDAEIHENGKPGVDRLTVSPCWIADNLSPLGCGWHARTSAEPARVSLCRGTRRSGGMVRAVRRSWVVHTWREVMLPQLAWTGVASRTPLSLSR